MTNSDIADQLKLYADLSELHGGNPFKIKSYASAAFRIDKLPVQLEGKTVEELEKIDGVGKSLATKIYEINATGSFQELNEVLQDTPEGVQQMLHVKGIGPKKIAFIWQELGIENIGELLYACNENRLAQAKGFGLKTQQNIRQSIEFMFANAHKYHYAKLESLAIPLLAEFNKLDEISLTLFSGELRRKCDVLTEIELIVSTKDVDAAKRGIVSSSLLQHPEIKDNYVTGKIQDTIPVKLFVSNEADFAYHLLEQTGSKEHLSQLGTTIPHLASEQEIYTSLSMDYIEPELREGMGEVEKAKSHTLPVLIEMQDLRGILHNHSTYSDGLNTLEEMAAYCKESGYEYLGICDHSKAAQYANGLKEDRIIQQHAEIDSLNKKLAPFKVFKGIECDILSDGSLDYSNDVLASFDFIVASIHSNLKMPEEKAMMRLIRAIENPYTTILGHPTGRLLLMREGYPVDHKKMIDACAANNVVIEINANPYRLDLDWRWIDYALNKNVMLSINPDAHEKAGYHDMYYGVCVARKGGLTKEMCLNTMNLEQISGYFSKRKSK